MRQDKKHPTVCPGDCIEITEKRCSSKQQPLIIVGGRYVVAEIGSLRDDTLCLVVEHPRKGKPYTLRVSARRFDWKVLSAEDVARTANLSARKLEAKVKLEERVALATLLTKQEIKELIGLPFLYSLIVILLADKCRRYTADHKLRGYVKVGRAYDESRRKFYEVLHRGVSRDALDFAEHEAARALCENGTDVQLMFFMVDNVLKRKARDIDHNELRAWATIGMMMADEALSLYDRADRVRLAKTGVARDNSGDGFLMEVRRCLFVYARHIPTADIMEDSQIVTMKKVWWNKMLQTKFDFE